MRLTKIVLRLHQDFANIRTHGYITSPVEKGKSTPVPASSGAHPPAAEIGRITA